MYKNTFLLLEMNRGSERGPCLGFNTCLLRAQSSELTLVCLVQNENTHTYIYTHTPDLYIFSVANAHNLHFSVALHFALNLTRSISSSNINSRPDAHTYPHAHTDCVSDLSLRHLLEVFVQILSLTLKWNVNVVPVKASCLPRCWFYPLQIFNIFLSAPPLLQWNSSGPL